MALKVDGKPIYSVTLDGKKLSNFRLDNTDILAPPTISVHPKGASIYDNQTHTMRVTASSLGGDYKYQWYVGANKPISGATGTSYTHPKSPFGQYMYYVKVTNGMGTVNSYTATVTVKQSATHHLSIGQRGTTFGFADSMGIRYGDLQPRTGVYIGKCTSLFGGISQGHKESWLWFDTAQTRTSFNIVYQEIGVTARYDRTLGNIFTITDQSMRNRIYDYLKSNYRRKVPIQIK